MQSTHQKNLIQVVNPLTLTSEKSPFCPTKLSSFASRRNHIYLESRWSPEICSDASAVPEVPVQTVHGWGKLYSFTDSHNTVLQPETHVKMKEANFRRVGTWMLSRLYIPLDFGRYDTIFETIYGMRMRPLIYLLTYQPLTRFLSQAASILHSRSSGKFLHWIRSMSIKRKSIASLNENPTTKVLIFTSSPVGICIYKIWYDMVCKAIQKVKQDKICSYNIYIRTYYQYRTYSHMYIYTHTVNNKYLVDE